MNLLNDNFQTLKCSCVDYESEIGFSGTASEIQFYLTISFLKYSLSGVKLYEIKLHQQRKFLQLLLSNYLNIMHHGYQLAGCVFI